MLTVTTAATNRRLAQAEKLLAEMGLPASSLQRLGDLIDQASRTVEGHCRRVLPRDTLSQVFRPGRSLDCLLLARVPVWGTPTVVEDGTSLALDDDFEIDRESGLLYRLVSDARSCWSSAKTVVGFQAGFALPGDEGRNLPEPIERATKIIARAAWFGDDRDPMLASVSGDDIGSVAYRAGNGGDGGLPDEAIDLLRPFILAK